MYIGPVGESSRLFEVVLIIISEFSTIFDGK